MAIKEKESLLPTSFDAVTDAGVKNGGRFAGVRSVFRWIHIAATTLIFCWLAILTLRPEPAPLVLPKDFLHELKNSQEVRSSSFQEIHRKYCATALLKSEL